MHQEGHHKRTHPPRSFFPDGEKEQLLTVKSCEKHNNAKSKNDLYVLAHICMNASPSNRAREVFRNKVLPQLEFNNGALRKKIANEAVLLSSGAVKYPVDVTRLDDFFSALSCGIIYKSCGSPLPENYEIRHIYHCFSECKPIRQAFNAVTHTFYSRKLMDIMEFGDPDTRNEKIYTVSVFGIPKFKSSITIVHKFYGVFKVTSMLTLNSTE
jgi:hypothetical protein